MVKCSICDKDMIGLEYEWHNTGYCCEGCLNIDVEKYENEVKKLKEELEYAENNAKIKELTDCLDAEEDIMKKIKISRNNMVKCPTSNNFSDVKSCLNCPDCFGINLRSHVLCKRGNNKDSYLEKENNIKNEKNNEEE